MVNLKMLAAAALLAVPSLAVATVSTQPLVAQAQTVPTTAPSHAPWRRGQHGSNRNIRMTERRLERVIDMLQHDQYDYGGHKTNALNYLNQARTELQAAIQYEQSHPGQ